MKSYLISIIILLSLTNVLQAQHINLGIKGGLNVSTIEGDNSGSYKTKPGFYLGLLGHIHLTDQFAIQPEAYYSVQGTQYKSGSSDLKLNLNYVNIPLLFQYMFDNGFRLQAGPQVGILVSANSVVSDSDTEVKSSYKNTDVALVAGMSYVKPSTGFGFDIRYNHGLSNINASDAVNSYNRGFQVGVFYLFQHRS
ncbi:MAG: porin family protein [Bacteroidota bacterium]